MSRYVEACCLLFAISCFAPAAEAKTPLYSQSPTPPGGDIAMISVGFQVPQTPYDNFTLSADASVNEITWVGTYVQGTPALSSFTLQIYNDNSGIPGASIFSTTVTDFHETQIGVDQLGEPYFSYDATGFSTPTLKAGTQYWLSIVTTIPTAPPYWDWELGTGGDGRLFYVGPDGVGRFGTSDLAFALYGSGCPVNSSNLTHFSGGGYSLDGHRTSMLGTFTPPSGFTLGAYASACGFAGFDWQQTITTLPCPGPVVPNNPSSVPRQDICPNGSLSAMPQTPVNDPPSGDYKSHLGKMNFDPYPFYYPSSLALSQEQFPTPGAPGTCVQYLFLHGPCVMPIVNADGTTLAFHDAPADPFLPRGSFMAFTTALVGIYQGGASSLPLYQWSWIDTYNGLSGGISSTFNDLQTDPGTGTGGITITSINGVLQASPSVTCAATPSALWPPNGKSVTVSVSGTITDGTQSIPTDGTTFAVADEYGQIQPVGTITLGVGGSYSFGVLLVASRNGNDLDGRTYSIAVNATDSIGNVGSCSTMVTVPHDQGH